MTFVSARLLESLDRWVRHPFPCCKAWPFGFLALKPECKCHCKKRPLSPVYRSLSEGHCPSRTQRHNSTIPGRSGYFESVRRATTSRPGEDSKLNFSEHCSPSSSLHTSSAANRAETANAKRGKISSGTLGHFPLLHSFEFSLFLSWTERDRAKQGWNL
jgi:hypothetical protein